MPSTRKRIVLALLLFWAATVGWLTLTPGGATPPLTLDRFVCIGCGWRHAADILLNWLLFVPAGALLACLASPRRVVALALIITCGIETIQIGVPGRDPALQDLIFNTLGALSGAGLILRGLSGRERRLLAAGIAVFWLAPAALLVPLTSDSALYGQWTPVFPGLESYEGQVLHARVGDLVVPSRQFPATGRLSLAVRRRDPVEVRMIAGPHPSTLSPIFQIYDGRRMEIAMIGALGSDLVLRGKNPARVLRLDQPDARWAGAFDGIEPGDTVTLRVERAAGSICASIDERRRCGLAPAAGDGWGFLLNPEGASARIRGGLSLLWPLLMGAVLSAALAGRAPSAGIAAVLAATGLAVAGLSPDVRPDVLHAGLLVLGSCAGPEVRSLMTGLRRSGLGHEAGARSPVPGSIGE